MMFMTRKKEKICLESIILKFFAVILMILILNFKFLGEINLYVSKLHERNSVNEVINTITKDLKKIVAVTKIK